MTALAVPEFAIRKIPSFLGDYTRQLTRVDAHA